MTRHEINQLADAIVERMMAKQREYDKEFKADMEELMIGNPNVALEITDQEDKIRSTIENLEEELATQIAEENYMKAAAIKAKIQKIKTKYNL